jgi:hypothetical protein
VRQARRIAQADVIHEAKDVAPVTVRKGAFDLYIVSSDTGGRVEPLWRLTQRNGTRQPGDLDPDGVSERHRGQYRQTGAIAVTKQRGTLVRYVLAHEHAAYRDLFHIQGRARWRLLQK